MAFVFSDGPERGQTVVVYLVCVCEKGTAMGGVFYVCFGLHSLPPAVLTLGLH